MSKSKLKLSDLSWRQVATVFAIAALIASVSYGVDVGLITPEQGSQFVKVAFEELAASAGMTVEQFNETLNSLGYEVNPLFLSTSSPYNYTIHPLSDRTAGATVYYVMASGNGTLAYSNTNRTHVEKLALGNMTTQGVVYCKNFAHNYSLTVPAQVSVKDSYNGTERTFCNSADSTGSPYTISVDETTGSTYYLAQDSAGRYINSFTSTNASFVLNTAIANGDSIYISSGTYDIDSPLIIGLNKKIYGFSPFGIATTVINNTGLGNAINITDGYVTLEDLVICGAGDGTGAYGVYATKLVQSTFMRLYVYGHGLEGVYGAAESYNFRMRDCIVSFNFGGGIYLFDAYGSIIDGNILQGNALGNDDGHRSGIYVKDSEGVVISNNVIENIGSEDDYVFEGIWAHSTGAAEIRSTKIISNYITDVKNAIIVNGTSTKYDVGSAKISDNRIYGTGGVMENGISVNYCIHTEIENNRVRSVSGNGITIGSTAWYTSTENNYLEPSGTYVNSGVLTNAVNEHAYPTLKSGSVAVANDGWISFGVTFPAAPQTIHLTMNESDANYKVQVKAQNTTHCQVYLFDLTAGSAEATPKTVMWTAIYTP